MGDRRFEAFQQRVMHSVLLSLTAAMSVFSTDCFAIDSYRYLHVTIDTPWWIFLFLLPAVLSPFILMAVLYWRFAGRKRRTQDHDEG